jgi:FlaA1/EpsC-like NDP-sugar epimerase
MVLTDNLDTVRDLQRRPYWPALRLLILTAAYSAVLLVCRWLAYQFRFDFAVPAEYVEQLSRDCIWVLCLQLVFLIGFGQFSTLTRYFSVPDLVRLFLAMSGSGLCLYLIRHIFGSFFSPPRGVLVVDVLLAFGGLAGLRFFYRVVHEGRLNFFSRASGPHSRAAIMGAGDVGANLVIELNSRPGLGLKPVVFLDDDPAKWSSSVHGVPVAGGPDSLDKWVRQFQLDKLIVAMPSASAKRVAEVAALAGKHGLSCVTVPAIDQLTSGQVKVSNLRPVSIEDLLGREPVPLETGIIRDTFAAQVVMVTGAGGSIGSELCRQLCACSPRSLLLVEQSEVQLFQIEQELVGRGHGHFIVPLAANILDVARMEAIFREHRPAVVFHAAAHKHVPMMERQPTEAIKNNSIATARLAHMALAFKVERFLMISTDKAVNPTSVMGASKRLAEVYLQALSQAHPKGTRFICVRFGNVLGSSGSVVPTFARQIAAGGPVTVTHPEMVRYFMTIPEAVGLVLQSCAQGGGGEIFVLDMGQPVKIATLARQMIELSGYRPEVDIEIKYVGLRPGEKLFEELKFQGESYRPTRHPRIIRFLQQPQHLARCQAELARIEAGLYAMDAAEVKKWILQLVPEYTPYADGNGGPKPAPLPKAEEAPASTPVPGLFRESVVGA